MAGAIQRCLVGPIWSKDQLMTEVRLGHPTDAPAGSAQDYRSAKWTVLVSSAISVLMAVACLVIAS